MRRFLATAATVSLSFLLSAAASADVVITGASVLEGDATIATGAGPSGNDVVRLRSQNPLGQGNTAGNIIWRPQTVFTWRQLTKLEATYKGESGTIRGGSPRYSIWFDWNNNGSLDADEDTGRTHLFALWGDPPSYQTTPTGGWENTGNFIGTDAKRFEVGQLSSTPPMYDDYARTLALAGDVRVLQIGIVVDAGWSQSNNSYTQQFLVDQVVIEGFIPTPPAGALFGAVGGSAAPGTPFQEILLGRPVPEPSAALLLTFAGVPMLLRRRRTA